MSTVNITIFAFLIFALGHVVGYFFAYGTLVHKAKGSIQYAIDDDDNYMFLALKEPADIFVKNKFVVLDIEEITT